MNRVFALTAAATLAASVAMADPCGMVPPISLNNVDITRIGLQNTYVFHKDGVETFVIRPGFSGNAEDFGMLIPFPKPPAIRKVPDNIFPTIEKAIDPPEVIVYANMEFDFANANSGATAFKSAAQAPMEGLRVDEVRVLNQEAVGMYEVAVLEAGSAAALKAWMDDHEYRFPDGMEETCNDYVANRWCFVAVKTRIGPKRNVDPQPGMRETQPGLPPGASFDGHVQAMGFRFPTDELVVPMRLSAFNAGELRNVVYVLTDGPRKIRAIPEEYVVRQLDGEELYRNVTEPLPIRVIGGNVGDIPEYRKQNLPQERNPTPHNGMAKDLFAGDLLTASTGQLSHTHEEQEKMLLRIGENLQLRGPEIDAVNYAELAQKREATLAAALDDLKQMTLTVVDGDFPREVLGSRNLTFAQYSMPGRRNNTEAYDAKMHAPGAAQQGGRVYRGDLSAILREEQDRVSSTNLWSAAALFGLGVVAFGVIFLRRKPARRANSN